MKKKQFEKAGMKHFCSSFVRFYFSYEGSLRHVPGQPRLCNTVEYT